MVQIVWYWGCGEGGCCGDGGLVPPFVAHGQKQTRQCLENGKHSQPENDVYWLLSMLTISWRRKKKREADCAFPSLLRLAPPQNFQGHVPLLFSFLFFVVLLVFFVLFFCMCHKLVQLPQAAFLFQNQSEK